MWLKNHYFVVEPESKKKKKKECSNGNVKWHFYLTAFMQIQQFEWICKEVKQ